MSCAVFPSTYRNLQHSVLRSLCSFFKMYQVLFQREASSKSNCNRSCRGQPSGLTVDCSSPLNFHVFVTLFTAKQIGRVNPSYHFYIALYSRFYGKQGITFTRPVFLFKINHDDGTVKHILSHLNTTQERYNDRDLIYRHIGRHCINYQRVLCIFVIILLVQAHLTFIGICKKIFHTCPSIGKCHTAVKIQPVYFVLAQFHPKKAMGQFPFFDIDY